MKLLFDQGTPAPPRDHLTERAVDTLAEKDWSDEGNGDLLNLAEREQYEVLVTTDLSLREFELLHARPQFNGSSCRYLALASPPDAPQSDGGGP